MKGRQISFTMTDSFPAIREGLVGCINNPDIKMLFNTHDTGNLWKKLCLSTVKPDICIISFKKMIPGATDIVKQIKDKWPQIKILACVYFKAKFFLVEAIENGIDGYITPLASPEEFSSAILKIVHKNTVYVADGNMGIFDEVKNAGLKKTAFTNGEITLMKIAAEYPSYSSTAKQLGLGSMAVKALWCKLFEKIGLKKMHPGDEYFLRLERSLYDDIY